jgi:hypothetical protein
MRLCLTCFHLSRAGSFFCGFCSRSFGVRLCGSKHANAPHVHFCTTCASSTLSEPTRFVRLGWIPFGITVLITLTVWRWTIAHLKAVVAIGWIVFSWMLAVLLNTSPAAIGWGTGRPGSASGPFEGSGMGSQSHLLARAERSA